MCHHYTYEVQTTALQPLECANTHISDAHTHACTRTHASTHTHARTHTDGLLFNGALLFFNERCSRSSLCCPPHYLSAFSLSFFLHSSALLYLHLPLSFFLPPLLYPMLSSFLLFRTVLFSLSCAPYSCSVFFLLPFLILLFLRSFASSSYFICIFPPFVLLSSLPSSFALFTPFS